MFVNTAMEMRSCLDEIEAKDRSDMKSSVIPFAREIVELLWAQGLSGSLHFFGKELFAHSPATGCSICSTCVSISFLI